MGLSLKEFVRSQDQDDRAGLDWSWGGKGDALKKQMKMFWLASWHQLLLISLINLFIPFIYYHSPLLPVTLSYGPTPCVPPFTQSPTHPSPSSHCRARQSSPTEPRQNSPVWRAGSTGRQPSQGLKLLSSFECPLCPTSFCNLCETPLLRKKPTAKCQKMITLRSGKWLHFFCIRELWKKVPWPVRYLMFPASIPRS